MSLRKSLVQTASAKYAEIGLAFISGVILARILTPEDFGIYSIAASIVLIGYLFRNFGVNQYVIQAETLTDDMLRTAFSITLAISWTIAAAIGLSAAAVGDYYSNPGLGTALLLLSLNFWMLPFGAVADAVLRRNMAFDKLAIITIAAAVVGLVVGVGSALMDARYLSIVWASNASTATTVLLTLYFRPAGLPWLPGWGNAGEVAKFGIKVGMLDLVARGGNSATELIIGKSHGIHDLGIYSRAFGVFNLVEMALTEGIKPVILPFLSNAKREQGNIGELYLQIMRYVSILMLPAFMFVFLMAEPMLLVLYGDQWGESVPVLEMLALAGPFLVPALFFDQLLIAHGRPGQALRIQLVTQVVAVGSLLALLSGSLSTLALALVFGNIAKVAMVIWLAHQYFQIRISDFARVLTPAVITMTAMGLVLVAAKQGLTIEGNAFINLFVAVGISSVVWLSCLFLLKHPLAEEISRLVRRC